MATTREILEFVHDTLLPSVDGGADYTLNLSDTGQVFYGLPPAAGPERSPSVYVWLDRVSSSHAGPASFRGFRHEVVIGLAGYAVPNATDGDTNHGRLTAAADLLDDIEMAVLKSNRLDTGSTKLAQSVAPEINAIDGAEVGVGAYGVCYGVIRITAIREQS